jgi:acetolactate synthase-1/2/3 large subunit
MPVTKHNYLVKDADDLDRVVREAFYVARTGRPARFWSTSLKTSARACQEREARPRDGLPPGYQPTYEGHVRQIDRAIDLIVRRSDR